MPTQIILALCEGPHDVTFLCKLLKCSGFVSNESLKIYEFPRPMNKVMEQELAKADLQELNLRQVRQHVLPLHSLQKGDNYVFLYSLGGDSKKTTRQSLLKKIKLSLPAPGEITKDRAPEQTELGVIYFFDADDVGIATRLSQTNNEVRTVLTSMPNDALTNNGSFGIFDGVKVGSYVFSGADNNTGKLEDILIPLMRGGNELIFDSAETYLDQHHDPQRLFPFKFQINPNSGEITEVRSAQNGDTDFERSKSIIGITGQLQRSGKANTVYISDADYLTLAKVRANEKCQHIISFFTNFLDHHA